MRRPTVLLLFATIFVGELGWSGIAPLLPDYQDRFGLSDTQTGFILSVSAVGILLVSLPAGALSRRFAVRTLTLWGMGALAAGNLVVGLTDSYPTVLAGRALLGVGLGTMWVTATAWLHDAAGEDSVQGARHDHRGGRDREPGRSRVRRVRRRALLPGHAVRHLGDPVRGGRRRAGLRPR